MQEILFCEVEKSSWTLMHRYYKVVELLKSGKMDILNRDHMVYIYIWLRYSFSKQLTFQRRFNTQPRQLQGAQIQVTNEICEQYKYAASK